MVVVVVLQRWWQVYKIISYIDMNNNIYLMCTQYLAYLMHHYRSLFLNCSVLLQAALAADVNDDVSEAGTDATMPLDDTSSISSTRRSSRRRTTTKKSPAEPKTASKKAPARRGGRRKVVSPVVEEPVEPKCDKEEEVNVQEDVKEVIAHEEEAAVKSEEVVAEETEVKKEVTEEIEW